MVPLLCVGSVVRVKPPKVPPSKFSENSVPEPAAVTVSDCILFSQTVAEAGVITGALGNAYTITAADAVVEHPPEVTV